jgi:hypothetical protein
LQAEWEEKEMKARRRSLGNIRFIGELYKLKMLTARIMHECLRKLLKTTDEECSDDQSPFRPICFHANLYPRVADKIYQTNIYRISGKHFRPDNFLTLVSYVR